MVINVNHGVVGDWLRHSGEIYTPVQVIDISTRINEVVDYGLKTTADSHPPRRYLGASILGHPCLRYLVYIYRDIVDEKYYEINPIAYQSVVPSKDEPIGRMRRIWDRGHDAEARIIRHMRQAGFVVEDRDPITGEQFRFEQINGTISGGIDGIVRSGPETLGDLKLPYPMLFEAKNINQKAWTHVLKHGLEKSKEIYWAQIHVYMAYFNLKYCLYCIENADTCERYWSLIEYDQRHAQMISDRAVAIVSRSRSAPLPQRITKNSDFYICKMCDRYTRCWKGDA